METLEQYVRCASGLFVTKENPKGLTPMEIKFLTVLLQVLKQQRTKIISSAAKVLVANQLNMTLGVATNYISKLKAKEIITEQNRVHEVFFNKQLTIINDLWKEQSVTPQSLKK